MCESERNLACTHICTSSFFSPGVKKKPSITNLYQLGEETGNDAGDREKISGLEDVLVITVVPPADCPGMIAEKKVGAKTECVIIYSRKE